MLLLLMLLVSFPPSGISGLPNSEIEIVFFFTISTLRFSGM